jgi:hypothetical protein
MNGVELIRRLRKAGGDLRAEGFASRLHAPGTRRALQRAASEEELRQGPGGQTTETGRLAPAVLSTGAVRLNISLAESLVHRIDAYVAEHHMNRSAFLAMAAERAMRSD